MTGESDRSPSIGDARSSREYGLDELFEALADRHRRYALYRLLEAGGELDLPTLVDGVLAWETDRDPERLPEVHHERVSLEFRHVHVPLLVDLGILECSEDGGALRVAADLGGMEPYLDFARADDGVLLAAGAGAEDHDERG